MLVIIRGFVFWFGCSLLSFFVFIFLFSFLFLIFLFFILITFFSFYFLSFLLSPFSSEPCIHALANCQACASEVGEPSSGHWSTRPSRFHIISNGESSPRDLHLNAKTHSTDPLNNQSATMLDTLCQTTSKTGTQTHPLTESLPKIIISSQTPQNTPPDVDLPTRKTRSSLIHQNTGTSPLHQESYTTHRPTLATGGRHQKQREIHTCSMRKGDTKHRV